MKRLVLLTTLLAFILGLAATASASVDVKASGDWKFAAVWKTGWHNGGDNFNKDDDKSNFDVWQRLRTYFQFIANENVKGVIGIEIGTGNWGALSSAADSKINNKGMSIGTDGNAVVEVKHAYIDFNVPNSEVNVKIGAMPMALPGGYAGNPVLDDDVAGIVASSPITDNVSIVGGWARPYTGVDTSVSQDQNSEIDAWFVAVPLTFDGFGVTPYAMYAYSGGSTEITPGSGTQGVGLRARGGALGPYTAWWGGFAADVTVLDPFNFTGHFVYGTLSEANTEPNRAGWEADVSASYTGFDFMTPEIYGIYMSGVDNDSTDDGRLPIVSSGLGIGNFWNGGGFINDAADNIAQANSADVTAGFWGIGLNLKDISFVDKLTHSIGIAYFKGTNDEIVANYTDSVYGLTLTDDDSLVEYSLKNEYQMYDQLKVVLYLAYLDTDMETDNWAGPRGDDDVYRTLVGVQYKF